MTAPRIALVGPRRSQQGLGPFMARFLVGFGAELPAIVGHRPETLEGGVRELRQQCGIVTEGFSTLAEAATRQGLDAVVIASPAETHQQYLEAALKLGLHTLCEKPFLIGDPKPVASTKRLVDGFTERGLLLMENVQWQETWGTYLELFPPLGEEVPERFEMWLSPHAGGRAMVVDSFSHPISLLQRILPGDDIDLTEIRYSRPDDRTLICEFVYRAGLALVESTITCRTQTEQPKPAAYAINGARADREVSLEDYSMSLRGGDRAIPMADPMESLLHRFYQGLLRAKAGQAVEPERGIRTRMRLFRRLVDAFDTAPPG